MYSQDRKFGEPEYTEFDERASQNEVYSESDFPDLPKSVDWEYLMPPAGNQKDVGACWAFACAYAIRSYLDNAEKSASFFYLNGQPDYSKIYSPEFHYQLERGDVVSCDAGQQSFVMLQKILSKTGSVKYSELPYSNSCDARLSASLIVKARKNIKPEYLVEKVKDYFTIKKVLAESHVLILSIAVDDLISASSMKNEPNKQFTPIWDTYGTKICSHAMVVVGYNDTAQAFKVLNSWGTKWGKDGYCWISYKIVQNHMNYACYAKIDKSAQIEKTPTSTEQQIAPTSSWPQFERLTAWFKEGYYVKFNKLRVGLAVLSKKKAFANVDIRNESGILLTSFNIDKKATKEFYVGAQKYKFTLNSIGRKGWNIFQPAAFFTVIKER